MGSSFIKLKDRGFWSRDGNLEDWLLAQIGVIDRLPSIDPWLRQLRDHWRVHATAGLNGCIEARLDEAIGTDEGRRALLSSVAEAARDAIEAGHTKVDASVRHFVLGLADSWLKLLRDEITDDETSPRRIPRRPAV
jgi:hypothetical protein